MPIEPPPPAILARHDGAGPRYTSYPTADHFGEAFGAADYRAALAARESAPLSLYVHLPFCASVCYYCACNKVVTRDRRRADAYLDALEAEVALHVQALGGRAAVSQLHLGGGTPTFLDDAQLARLMRVLRDGFHVVAGAETGIEIDPRTIDLHRLLQLQALGFDRLSFGVQDLDANVQRAVHRVQPFADIEALVRSARHIGFESINVDLIYGLPRQTRASFAHTLTQIGLLRPDRIALYAYAHLPERFKPQRRILAAELPGGGDKAAMLQAAITAFGAGGYAHIGMDHFALESDALAIAKRQGRLHRNFQGYGARPDGDLIGLGVSAIGRVGDAYAQNAKDIDSYAAAVHAGRFATVRGLALDAEDRLRRDLVMAIMCRGRVDLDALESAHGVTDLRSRFAGEWARLGTFADDGLLVFDAKGFELTPPGWFVVRAVAMVFDGWLGRADGTRYSRIL